MTNPVPRFSRGSQVVHRIVTPVQEFIQTEVFSGAVLLFAAVVAIVWANSPLDSQYADLFGSHLKIDGGFFRIDEDLRHWINDGLMTLFFFVVGLEIKRELFRGELRGFQRAALPGVAALGGMIVPALIYTAFNAGGDGGQGWGVPMATDIAFTLGILALLGRRIPSQLRVFLLALAIVDDIGAILVIAVFYTGDIQLDSLAIAGGLLVLIFLANRFGIEAIPVYAVIGIIVWLAVFESGIHATIAGVVLGLMTPLDSQTPGREPPLTRLEHWLHPLASFAIIPLFALANAGVSLDADSLSDAIGTPVTSGVALGLVLGKPLGIVLFSWLAVRLGIAALPDGISWGQMLGVGVLAGVGFTVALFVNELAFDSVLLIERGKIGILAGSLVAGVAGFAVLFALGSRHVAPESD